MYTLRHTCWECTGATDISYMYQKHQTGQPTQSHHSASSTHDSSFKLSVLSAKSERNIYFFRPSITVSAKQHTQVWMRMATTVFLQVVYNKQGQISENSTMLLLFFSVTYLSTVNGIYHFSENKQGFVDSATLSQSEVKENSLKCQLENAIFGVHFSKFSTKEQKQKQNIYHCWCQHKRILPFCSLLISLCSTVSLKFCMFYHLRSSHWSIMYDLTLPILTSFPL